MRFQHYFSHITVIAFIFIYFLGLTRYQTTKFLDQSNLKDFADDKINVNYVTNFVTGRVENIVEKREHAGYQHVLLFPTVFTDFLSGSLKVGIF